MAKRKRDRHILRRIFVVTLTAIAVSSVAAVSYVGILGWHYYETLQGQVDAKFRGRRWELPSRVYSAPFAVYPGMDLDGIGFMERLKRLGYVEVAGTPSQAGDYRWMPSALDVVLRGDSVVQQDPQHVRVELVQKRIVRLVNVSSGEELPLIEIAPEPIAGIYDEVWESRALVSVADVPSLLVQSILATEDRRFFEHSGVDWRAVARALWVNMRAGGVRQGGSTLTQQLMKNFFLTTDRTLQRKVVELLMALIAEQRYAKLEILENYLNEIYLGQNGARGVFGIREGARFYFGKDPSELSLAQMALLAGLIQAPNRYSPYHAPERALERRQVVLSRMHDAGMITDADYAEARVEPLNLRHATPSPRTAPYFVDYVRDELANAYDPTVLTQDGLQIYTTLDAQLQVDAERAVSDGLKRLEKEYPWLVAKEKGESSLEACLVAIQPQTGEIKAMVGGRNYGASQFNRATRARRQVGSLFKPVVFATALAQYRESGDPWLPTSRVEDSPFEWTFDAQTWKPANYADRYFGFVSIRSALERSLNAATARTAHEVGLQSILTTARRLGFDGSLPAVPAIVLGAGEATPLQVARVYATFANGGLRPAPLAGRRITTGSGDVLEWRGVRLDRAITPEVAFMITHMLQGVLERGTGRSGRLAVPATGKTGTTDGYRDAWFAGYTPELVAVVWVGFDHGRAVGLPGSRAALPIWSEFMRKATAGRPVALFQPPPGIGYARIDPETGGLATPSCPESIEEAFPIDALPTTPCALHSMALPWQQEAAESERPEEPHRDPRQRWWPF